MSLCHTCLRTAGIVLLALGCCWSSSVAAPAAAPARPQPALPSEPEAFEARMASARGMLDMLHELMALGEQVQDAASARRFLDAVAQTLQTGNSTTPGAELVRLTPGHQAQLDALWDEVMEQNALFAQTCFNIAASVSVHQGYGDEELKRAYSFAMVMFMSQKLPELHAQQEQMNDMFREMRETQGSAPAAPAP